MQQALGGAARIAAIQDVEESDRASIWNNSGRLIGEVRKRTRWIRPNLLRVDQTGPGNTYVLYFDGTSGWEILPDRRATNKTSGEVIELAGDELRFATDYLEGFMLIWFADRIPGVTITSPSANVVRIARGDKASDITLDPNTWLPVKQTAVSLADSSRPPSAEMRMSEWKNIEGIWFPTKKANYHNGIKLAEGVSEEIKVNAGLKQQDLAEKPTDFSPVLSFSVSVE
jgi:hypothetical protein